MIILGFFLTGSILLAFAFLAGNMFHFLNCDSLLISPLAAFLFSLSTYKCKELVKGVKTMFMFSRKKHAPNPAVAAHYKALMLVSLAMGVVSTIQGLVSYALSRRDAAEMALAMPLSEAFSYAIFSTAYGIMYSVFLFYPVYLLHRNDAD